MVSSTEDTTKEKKLKGGTMILEKAEKEGLKVKITEVEFKELPALIGYRYAREALKESYEKGIPFIVLLTSLSEKITKDIFGTDPLELTKEFFKDQEHIEITLKDLKEKDFDFIKKVVVFIGMVVSQCCIKVEKLTEELKEEMIGRVVAFAEAAEGEAIKLFGATVEEDYTEDN